MSLSENQILDVGGSISASNIYLSRPHDFRCTMYLKPTGQGPATTKLPPRCCLAAVRASWDSESCLRAIMSPALKCH